MIYKMILPANKIFDVDSLGNIKANIMEHIFSNPKVTKKKYNVIERMENCLIYGKEVKSIKFDLATSEIIIEAGDEDYEISKE